MQTRAGIWPPEPASRATSCKPGHFPPKAEFPSLNPDFQILKGVPGLLTAESRSLYPEFKWLEAEFPPVTAE